MVATSGGLSLGIVVHSRIYYALSQLWRIMDYHQKVASTLAASALLTGCMAIDLKPGYVAYVGQRSSPDVVGDPTTGREVNNAGRYESGQKGSPSRGRGPDREAGIPTPPPAPPPIPSPPPSAPPPTPSVAPAPGPTMDAATIVGLLGEIWQNLRWPQPIDPAIGRYIGGFGAAIDALQRGLDIRSLNQANEGMRRIRDRMGPNELKVIHIRKGTDGQVKVYEVPKRFEPILKSPGETVIEVEIVTPPVIIRQGSGVRFFFISNDKILSDAKAAYDSKWAVFYKELDEKVDLILVKAKTK